MKQQTGLPRSLSRITFVGDVIQYHFDVDGCEFIVEEFDEKGAGHPSPGEKAMLSWSVEDTLVFGADQ